MWENSETREKMKVLFLCTGNSCRSQMAEGWCRHLKGDVIEAYSAGIETHGLNPNAVKVMAEVGVNISGHRSKLVDELLNIDFDYVITVCGHANEHCPFFPGKAKIIHVGFDDPPKLAKLAKTEEEVLECYRRVRDQIREFVEKLTITEGGLSYPPMKEDNRGLENQCSVGEPELRNIKGRNNAGDGIVLMKTDCFNTSSHSHAWQEGTVESPAGIIPLVSTILTFKDRIGTIKARWNIGRMDYKIPPGLYGIGNPVPDSPVLVTANYKLTFDRLRKELKGLNVWILVLNTEGINVWCAAGKGSFGTEEIVKRIQMVNLTEVVSHRTIVIPQLGAPGVAAHDVFRESGFRVVYGPVYAHDLPAFLSSGMTASHEMRRVHFNMIERMAVVPVELTIWFKYLAFGTLALCLIAGLREFDLNHFKEIVFLMLAAYLIGEIAVPLFLPWIPGRAFALKGALLGAVFMGMIYFSGILHQCTGNNLEAVSWWITLPSLSSFLGMQFTGCSTFTSQSGVRRELKVFFPLQIMGLASGFILNVISQFIER